MPTKSKSTRPTNPLLVKATVGKAKPSVYALPPDDHVYGQPIYRNPSEDAHAVFNTWNVKSTSKNTPAPLDYIAMNKHSASQGIITAKETREYRKSHPIRFKNRDILVNQKISNEKGQLRARISLPSDKNINFTYGKPTRFIRLIRPSTPVATLMTDKYLREWTEHKEKLESIREKKKKANALIKRQYNVAPAREPPPVPKDPKSLFKLSRFLKIPAFINSHIPQKKNAQEAKSAVQSEKKIAFK